MQPRTSPSPDVPVDPDGAAAAVPAAGPRDDAWFEGLFRAHATAVLRYLVRRGAREDAEDLAADVLAVASVSYTHLTLPTILLV